MPIGDDAAMETDAAAHDISTETVQDTGQSTSQAYKPTFKAACVHCTLDLSSVRRCFKVLFDIEGEPFIGALGSALRTLYDSVQYELSIGNAYSRNPSYINLFLIALEMPLLQSSGLESALPNFFKAIAVLPHKAQADICRQLASGNEVVLKDLVGQLQQLIAVQIMTKEWHQNHHPNEDIICTGATRLMRLVFYANMLASKSDKKELLNKEKSLTTERYEKLQNILQGKSYMPIV